MGVVLEMLSHGRSAYLSCITLLLVLYHWPQLATSAQTCDPIDPSSNTLPENPCFTVEHLFEGTVALSWTVSNSASLVYIYDKSSPYRDPGFAAADCSAGAGQSCGITVSGLSSGYNAWTLKVNNEYGRALHVDAAIDIPSLSSPSVTGMGGDIDFFNPEARLLRWTASSDNGWDEYDVQEAWVEIGRPDGFGYMATRFPRSGPNAEYLIDADFFDTAGRYDFRVRDCVKRSPGETKFCSEPALVSYRVVVDRFLEASSVYVDANTATTVEFSTGTGDFRMLASETLIKPIDGWPIAVTQAASYTFDSATLTPGVHKVELVSCCGVKFECANRAELDQVAVSGVIDTVEQEFYYSGDLVAEIIAADGGILQQVYAPVDGFVFFNREWGESVVAGDDIGYVITDVSDVLYILVDNPVDWALGRDYTLDFEPGEAVAIQGDGQPLDIAFDRDGAVWLTKEFSNSLEYFSTSLSATPEAIEMPLARYFDSGRATLGITRPFQLWISLTQMVSAHLSTLSEKVVVKGNKVWFTQGGGLQPARTTSSANHSRLLSMDLAADDSPSDLFDSRICAYNLPSDHPDGDVDSQLLGMTHAGGRVWLAESRGLLSDRPSVISSFYPSALHCNNLMNFDDPEALGRQSLQYCKDGQSPEQDACMERFVLDMLPSNTKVAHLEADPTDGSIWFTDARGRILGHLRPDAEVELEVFEFEDTHSDPFNGLPRFGGFPWTLRVDENAVYINEYSTRHLLRFDKETRTFSEVHVPCGNAEVTLHSIDLDRERGRLWFTLANESRKPLDPEASTIGYVDIRSWQDHVENPELELRISAVLYSGLASIPPSAHHSRHQAFRGIDVEAGSGRIALASMWRNQITLLVPLPGF